MKMCIAVPTFRRPALLDSLLAALQDQIRLVPDAEVLVTDNDAVGSARAVVERFSSEYPVPLHYRLVTEPGVSAVRNHALGFASAFDLLVMIDDDELPRPGWLAELLRVQMETQADAVVGPVISQLPVDAPPWVMKGRFFEHEFNVPDGGQIRDGHTGNCLLRMATILSLALAFSPRLNTTGGEDTLFFRQLRARGGRLVYAAGAVAVERVPASRVTVRYLWRRYLRWGTTMSFCDHTIYGTPGALALRTGKALGNIVLGAVAIGPVSLYSGKAGTVTALCNIARGLGMLIGLIGFRINEYR
jgi:GT2 family glycosyltransferase